jgi:hypothetical protein
MKKKNLLMTVVAILGLSTITSAQVPNYVPANGLVGWWPFNGNSNDESGNGNNGTVNGATLTADRFGNANKAYSFNGSNNSITTSLTNIPGNSYTISTWFNTATQQINEIGLVVSRTTSNVSTGLYLFNNIQYLQSTSTCSSFHYNSYVVNALNDSNWHFYAATFNGSTFCIYVDGNLVSSINSNIQMCINAPFVFGNDNLVPNRFFNGIMDDVGIWNRALTACEIKDLYNAQLNSSASIQAGTDVSICEGNDVIFNGSGGSNYTWNNGVQNGVAYIPTISQEYIVIGQDANNCYGKDTIYVELMPNTAATQTETALDSYTWPINSQTYTQSGTYTAVITNAAGCDSTITLELSLDFTGLEDNSQGALFSVFPNPAQSIINVTVDNKLIGDVYSISDNEGRIVMTGKLNSQNSTIELGNLSGGIYLFSVGENLKQTFKVIKE